VNGHSGTRMELTHGGLSGPGGAMMSGPVSEFRARRHPRCVRVDASGLNLDQRRTNACRRRWTACIRHRRLHRTDAPNLARAAQGDAHGSACPCSSTACAPRSSTHFGSPSECVHAGPRSGKSRSIGPFGKERGAARALAADECPRRTSARPCRVQNVRVAPGRADRCPPQPECRAARPMWSLGSWLQR
jgi:hypothetical protein